jgi:hypothetical protein
MPAKNAEATQNSPTMESTLARSMISDEQDKLGTLQYLEWNLPSTVGAKGQRIE